MTRIPGIFSGPAPAASPGWELRPNPEYVGEPRPIKAVCHDGSPFLTVVCGCGEPQHFHESQLEQVPGHAEIASRCRGCPQLLVFPPGWFQSAFAQMRSDGWIE
jgi:hypothetical protein